MFAVRSSSFVQCALVLKMAKICEKMPNLKTSYREWTIHFYVTFEKMYS